SDLRLVRDIRPGPEPSKIVGAAAFNGMLYFSANDGIHGAELWRSNGTEAGTVLVSDIFPGVDSSSPGNFITFQNELVFSANDGVNGIELWHSDGTASGTELGRDIYPGPTGSRPGNFFAVDGKLLFTANNGPTRTEWWRAYAQGDYYPLARFSTDMSSGVYPLTVQFTDHSVTGAASITDWLWDFGDGETSTERNPVHTYLDRGRYTVTLTVTTPLGTHTYVVPNGVWAAEEMPAATGIGIALGMIALILTSFTRLRRTKSGN
ncbi:MAG: hypothetical protein QG656_87, partial [Candidatus Hydrogenedentes bacterium]|nr:hypothetical protein [Candidatus Hydrogenedentota bacterium]